MEVFASSKEEDKILENFSDTLSKLGFEHNLLSNRSKRLGTNFYNIALHTKEDFVTSR